MFFILPPNATAQHSVSLISSIRYRHANRLNLPTFDACASRSLYQQRKGWERLLPAIRPPARYTHASNSGLQWAGWLFGE
jgi:hypothetical protein